MRLLQRIKTFFNFGGLGGIGGNSEGIPVSYPWNWWQRNLPAGITSETAIVHACADAISQCLALLPPEHTRTKKNGGREPLPTSALSNVMRNPNAYQTRADFLYYLTKALMLNGNSYAAAIRNERQDIVELHPLHTKTTLPFIEPESRAIFYGVGNNPMLAEDLNAMIPQRDILHLKLYTPRHPLIGVSPIQHAASSIAANQAITSHQATFFNNMSRPSGILSTDAVLKKEQMETLRDAWGAQSQGLNSGKVPVLFGGLKFQQLSVTSQDAQCVEAFSMTVSDIARAFRVPLPLVGDYRNQNYNNTERLIAFWLATGLGFIIENLEQAIAKFFKLPANQGFQLNTDAILRTDFKGRVDGLTKGITGGLFSPNEARRKEGLPEVKDGNEPRLQAQVVPLSQVNMTPAEPAPAAPAAPAITEDEQKLLSINYLKTAMEG